MVGVKLDLIKDEIETRDNKERQYKESETFGLKNLNMYHQILGTDKNKILTGVFADETPKEMLKNYKRVILHDKDGSIVDYQHRLQVIKSLENSIDSMGYINLTTRQLDDLKPGDENSFLITSKGFDLPEEGSFHHFSAVTRKDQNGDFIVSTVDKARVNIDEPQVYIHTIKGDKIRDFAGLITPQYTSMDYFTFYDEIQNISEHYEEKTYKMAALKAGNCYIKEMEASLKYALWSRNPKGESVKWPISTLEMHERFNGELVKMLDKAGYNKLTEVIKIDFEKYKSEKKEINFENWQRKKENLSGRLAENDEHFSHHMIDLLEDEKKLRDHLEYNEREHGELVKKVQNMDKEGENLKSLYEDKLHIYQLGQKESVILDNHSKQLKKLNPILKFFKRSKIRSIRKQSQQLNENLVLLKGELNNSEKNVVSHQIKKRNYIKNNQFKFDEYSKEIVELGDKLSVIQEFKEKSPYLFKAKKLTLNINERLSQSIEKAKI